MRGTPQQIIEKYLALARDAQLSNDRVAEQAFFQHAEHYTRLLGEAMKEQAERQQQQQQQNNQQHHNRSGDEQQSRGGDDGRDQPGRDDNGQGRNDTQERRDQPEARHAPQNNEAARQPEAPRQSDAGRQSDAPRQPVTAEQPDSRPEAGQDTDATAVQDGSRPRNQRGGRRPVAALPDAVSTDAEPGDARVDTPEEKAPARRTRAPRSTSAAPRTRRKPAAEDSAAAAPAADGAE